MFAVILINFEIRIKSLQNIKRDVLKIHIMIIIHQLLKVFFPWILKILNELFIFLIIVAKYVNFRLCSHFTDLLLSIQGYLTSNNKTQNQSQLILLPWANNLNYKILKENTVYCIVYVTLYTQHILYVINKVVVNTFSFPELIVYLTLSQNIYFHIFICANKIGFFCQFKRVWE